jgi:hypothetical protein
MNNNDLRRLILSFLRKKAQLNCTSCGRVLIWDKKVCDFYGLGKHDIGNLIFDNLYNSNFRCISCWKRDMSFLTWSGT